MIWSTTIEYADIETGEKLSREVYTIDYYTIARDKEVIISENKTYGQIKYLYIGRRKPKQGEFEY